MRFFLLILLLAISTSACTDDESPRPTAYSTDGTAKLQVCKGLGIEKCDYEPKDIPEVIDLRDPYWVSLRSERKSSTLTMCYLDQPRGVLTKRLLMFECKPIFDQPMDIDIGQSQPLPENLIQSLANLAEAAATFEVCADDAGPDAQLSLQWTGYSLALGDIVEHMSERYQDDRLLLEYEMRRVQFYASEGFKSESLTSTGYCGVDSFKAGDRYVREAQSIYAPQAVR